MIGVRLNTFNDNSGEPEQDANSALTELDKGLRSGKVGEQCEAIVRFPRLFEKYPFPILINSSFLKLSDVFRMGNNFLRLWVLRVCQQSEKHLDKILNVDEFLRRIFSVLHSNDPVARALALRTLGAVAGIIPERQNVHHAIRRGLDSHDNVEVDAAIYATTRFAAHSNAFAVSMCNKLSDMVEAESTAAERRAKLVRALKNVHGGAVRAQGVLKLLRSLLEKFPSSSSVRAAITAITAIAADTVVHVPDQVELLLSLAMNDPRSAVRRAALLGLKKLAAHAALWPQHCIQSLVQAASETNDPDHIMLCLQVMQILVSCPAVCAAGAAGGAAALRGYCNGAALSCSRARAATAATVLTAIAVHCYQENLPVEGGDLMVALETLVIATSLPSEKDNLRPLRIALRCLVQLSKAQPTTYASRTAKVLTLQLESCDWKQNGGRLIALLEALAALGAHTHCVLTRQTYSQILANANADDDSDGTALVLLCTIVFQERAAAALKYTLDKKWQDVIKEKIAIADGWTRYRVARAALRYGHHALAADILQRLCEQAPTESVQRWLTALHGAAHADATLVKEGCSALEWCAQAWERSGALAGGGWAWCGAGCAGCGACVPAAPAWMRARARAAAALARAAAAVRAATTQPKPAIAQAARDPAAKAGACASAIKKAAKSLALVAQQYGDIARTAFYADDSTLRMYYISQHTYSQLAQFLDRVVSSSSDPPADLPTREMKATTLEERIALVPSEAIARISSKLFDNPTTGPGITHRHTEAVLAGVRACAAGALWAGGALGGRGEALCRVSLCPAARAPPADHLADHHLALKLDGVILRPPTTKRRKLREVKGVQLTVTATPHPRTNEKCVELTNIPPVLTAVQTVTPVRDFFSAQQLVSVGTPGLYTVAVEAAFVDEDGELWNAGPRTCVVVKAHEDPSLKGNAQAARGRF